MKCVCAKDILTNTDWIFIQHLPMSTVVISYQVEQPTLL